MKVKELIALLDLMGGFWFERRAAIDNFNIARSRGL